jgi:hypothetical protein
LHFCRMSNEYVGQFFVSWIVHLPIRVKFPYWRRVR